MNESYKSVRENFVRQLNPTMDGSGLSHRDRENLGRALALLDGWATAHPNASIQELSDQAKQMEQVVRPGFSIGTGGTHSMLYSDRETG